MNMRWYQASDLSKVTEFLPEECTPTVDETRRLSHQ